MLQWSSCLFATVAMHAYHKRSVAYHHLFLWLTVTSVLFHCEHHPVVRIVDKILAHLSFILVLFDTPKAIADDALWLLIFPLTAASFWFAQSFWPDRSEQLHCALHAVGVCGMHVYLAILY
jgi:hypothetical protein